ncbi:MAG: OB-fold domain-containing protein [Acidimicrobiia bacterium]
MPVPPLIDESSTPYWEGAKRHELVLVGCDDCGHLIHYPFARCPACHSAAVSPTVVPGTGTVVSHTTTQRAPAPEYADDLPIRLVLVELDVQVGLRVAATIADGEGDPSIGDRVELTYVDHPAGGDHEAYSLGQFRHLPTMSAR